MEFQLMNAKIYTGFADEKDAEEILARLNVNSRTGFVLIFGEL